MTANNNHEFYPTLAGEVYSDTLAELFWVDDGSNPFLGIREYDIYRDGELAETRTALSWLDENYTPIGHSYFIDTNPERYRDDYRLRSETLELPLQVGTRSPASVGNPRVEVLSVDSLQLSWDTAAWGVEPLHYEVMRGDTLVGVTSDTYLSHIMPNVSYYGFGYAYQITTVDANGRRSSPMPLYTDLRESLQLLLPREPINLHGSDVMLTSVTLYWELNEIGTVPSAYEIVRNGEIVDQTSSSSSYTDTALEADTLYRYAVRSLDEDGNQSLPAIESLRVLTRGGPFLPEKVVALPYGPSTIEVIWPRAVSGATTVTEYQVFRDDIFIATVDALSLMEYEFAPATTYTYSIRSVGSRGNASEDEVTTTVTTPSR